MSSRIEQALPSSSTAQVAPEVSILVVSYNTREITLACLASVREQTKDLRYEVIVVDNASQDGSAEAIAQSCPWVRLVASPRNLGFAAGNNLAATHASAPWLLLLNPDTVVLEGAIQKLLRFAQSRPDYGIFGGRTLFADGSLNPTSCWRRSTPWSLFCRGTGLAAVFRHNACFDPESYGRWPRDTIREVDVVTGCLLLISRAHWDLLHGFDESFFMYGEEADLCLRARKLGIRGLFYPGAEIIHYGGKSERVRADKVVRLLGARRRVMERHWHPAWQPFGRWMQALWVYRRSLGWRMLARFLGPSARERAHTFTEVWRRRAEWYAAAPAKARSAD